MKKKSEKQGGLIKMRIPMTRELYAKVKRASEEAGLSIGAWIADAVLKYGRRVSARLSRG